MGRNILLYLILFFGAWSAQAEQSHFRRTDNPLVYQLDDGKKLVLMQLMALPGVQPEMTETQSIEYTSLGYDRHGRIMGDAPSLQKRLITEGSVIAYPQTPEAAAWLYPLETQARYAQKGVWNTFNVIPAEEAASCIQRFCIIEGRVKAIAKQQKNVYINFGEQWQTDFTVQLPLKTTMNIDQLPGKILRVRGWVQEYNGPFIDITNTALVEIL